MVSVNAFTGGLPGMLFVKVVKLPLDGVSERLTRYSLFVALCHSIVTLPSGFR